ncbi:hypothetical protein QBC40DRAFT_329502 [Triangularia verruculosa]|uniref:Ankyrin repeat protein n=1 Tax=Triangularia verruculosa TaxID=2587418 RepID=A0AAN6XK91_9PEZI|nr:hypothetical protein QBC40DRAFT_329502 [Triangularia verruculosa]
MADLILTVSSLSHKLSKTYHELAYRIPDCQSLTTAINTVSVEVNACRRIQEQLNAGPFRVPIPPDLSDRLEANLEDCRGVLWEAGNKANSLMSGHASSLAQLGGASSSEVVLWARAREFNRTAEAIQLQITQQLMIKALDILAVSSNSPPEFDASPKRTATSDTRRRVQKLHEQVMTENMNKRTSTVHAALSDVCAAPGVNNKRTKVIRTLLDWGADPGLPMDTEKTTCLQLASYWNDTGALHAFRDSLTRKHPATGSHTTDQSVAGRYYEGTRGRWKALLSWKNSHHSTVLHMAAFGVNPEAMSFLLREIEEEGLQRHVGIDGRNKEGNTPLLTSVKRSGGWDRDRVRRVAKMLLKAGASPDIADDNGQTPRRVLAELGLGMPPMPKRDREGNRGRH